MVNYPKIGTALALALTSSLGLAAAPASLEGGTWLLSQVAGQAAGGAHLRFAAGKVQGSDACNTFRSSYEAGTAQSLRFAAGGGASTLMACAPEQDRTAKAFKDALAQTQSYQIAETQLQLLGAENKVLAVLTLQNDKLDGSKWQLQGLNNGNNAVVSQAGTEQLHIAFLPKGQFSASTPCGGLKSYWRANGKSHSITIRKPRADGTACTKPDAAFAEQQQLRKALAHSDVYTITGDRLELRDKKGALQISAKLVR
jgi:heat shock protein HslJ